MSIYYAVDAQNRLNDAANLVVNADDRSNDDSGPLEPRYHDLAHRFAPFVEQASVARRHRHRHKHNKNKHSKSSSSKSSSKSSNDKKPDKTLEKTSLVKNVK